MSKVCLCELNFYLSRTIGHRFWRTLNYTEKLSLYQSKIVVRYWTFVNKYLSFRKPSEPYRTNLCFDWSKPSLSDLGNAGPQWHVLYKIYLTLFALFYLEKTEYESVKIPTEFDSRQQWSECKSLNEIRDQGSCGSCWVSYYVCCSWQLRFWKSPSIHVQILHTDLLTFPYKISRDNLTKDQSISLWWLFYWFLLPFLLFIYRYCEEIIVVGHTRDSFNGLGKPHYSFTNERSRETANHGRRLQQIGGLMPCSKRNWRELSALNLWNSGYPAVDFLKN